MISKETYHIDNFWPLYQSIIYRDKYDMIGYANGLIYKDKEIYKDNIYEKKFNIATAMLKICDTKKTFIICSRKIQNTIRDTPIIIFKRIVEANNMPCDFINNKIVHEQTGSIIIFCGFDMIDTSMAASPIIWRHGLDIFWIYDAMPILESQLIELEKKMTFKMSKEKWVTFDYRLPDYPCAAYDRYFKNQKPGTYYRDLLE